MYQRDAGRMRDDNVVDYPWLLFSVVTLMRAYDGEDPSRRATLAGLLNGLSADPWAFVGTAPTSWDAHAPLRGEFSVRCRAHRDELLSEFEARRPNTKTYSALGFQCNFLCNALVAMVATSLGGKPPAASLGTLLCAPDESTTAPAAIGPYAEMLTAYSSVATGSAGGATLVLYDPYEAQHSFNTALRVLQTAS
jgi:hypothetical protein